MPDDTERHRSDALSLRDFLPLGVFALAVRLALAPWVGHGGDLDDVEAALARPQLDSAPLAKDGPVIDPVGLAHADHCRRRARASHHTAAATSRRARSAIERADSPSGGLHPRSGPVTRGKTLSGVGEEERQRAAGPSCGRTVAHQKRRKRPCGTADVLPNVIPGVINAGT